MFQAWFRQNQDRNAEACRCNNQHLIELRQVVKTYETAAGPVMVLKNINLQIDKGEFVAVSCLSILSTVAYLDGHREFDAADGLLQYPDGVSSIQ